MEHVLELFNLLYQRCCGGKKHIAVTLCPEDIVAIGDEIEPSVVGIEDTNLRGCYIEDSTGIEVDVTFTRNEDGTGGSYIIHKPGQAPVTATDLSGFSRCKKQPSLCWDKAC